MSHAFRPPPSPAEILAALPHRPPFRFIDEIVELDDAHVVARQRFSEDAFFYEGHFPGQPVTPGVILVEAMAQAGVAALGLYLVGAEGSRLDGLSLRLCEAEVEFLGSVWPGDEVTIVGHKRYFRRGKLRAGVEMIDAGGRTVCAGELAGIALTR